MPNDFDQQEPAGLQWLWVLHTHAFEYNIKAKKHPEKSDLAKEKKSAQYPVRI